ncbi:hypothetical protein T439DRAFT_320132 [Meredithblackwellia eburnea MCA 4105]
MPQTTPPNHRITRNVQDKRGKLPKTTLFSVLSSTYSDSSTPASTPLALSSAHEPLPTLPTVDNSLINRLAARRRSQIKTKARRPVISNPQEGDYKRVPLAHERHNLDLTDRTPIATAFTSTYAPATGLGLPGSGEPDDRLSFERERNSRGFYSTSFAGRSAHSDVSSQEQKSPYQGPPIFPPRNESLRPRREKPQQTDNQYNHTRQASRGPINEFLKHYLPDEDSRQSPGPRVVDSNRSPRESSASFDTTRSTSSSENGHSVKSDGSYVSTGEHPVFLPNNRTGRHFLPEELLIFNNFKPHKDDNGDEEPHLSDQEAPIISRKTAQRTPKLVDLPSQDRNSYYPERGMAADLQFEQQSSSDHPQPRFALDDATTSPKNSFTGSAYSDSNLLDIDQPSSSQVPPPIPDRSPRRKLRVPVKPLVTRRLADLRKGSADPSSDISTSTPASYAPMTPGQLRHNVKSVLKEHDSLNQTRDLTSQKAPRFWHSQLSAPPLGPQNSIHKERCTPPQTVDNDHLAGFSEAFQRYWGQSLLAPNSEEKSSKTPGDANLKSLSKSAHRRRRQRQESVFAPVSRY